MDARIAHETEPEFGSGLRKHLGKLNAPAEPEPDVPPFGQAGDVVAHIDKAEAAPAASPSTEELAALADDLELRTAMVAAAEADLFEREQRFADEAEALKTQPAAVEEAATEEEAEPVEESDPRPVPEVLRERLERRVELVWRAVEGALDAADADGKPDHKTRLQAARLLIAAAYPSEGTPDSTADPMPAVAAELEDELARLRDRRLEWGQSS